MKKSVAIIVLNWNGVELTIDCLKSLESITYNNTHVLVVDNGSTDDSVARIAKTFPHIVVLRLENNLGFSAGNNHGFTTAKKKWNPDYCIFLNNDTIVDRGFVEALIKPFADDTIHITVPKIYYHNNPETIWYAGGKLNLWLGKAWHVGIREKDSPEFNQKTFTDYATGCCLCVRTDIYAEQQGFSEDFAMYAEDTDLSLRIRKAGGKIQYVPDSKIWHKVSASIGGAFSMKKVMRKITGNMQLFRKHARWYQWITIIFYSPVQIIEGLVKYFKYK